MARGRQELIVTLIGKDEISGTLSSIEGKLGKFGTALKALVAVKGVAMMAGMALEGARFRAQIEGLPGSVEAATKSLATLQKQVDGTFSFAALTRAQAMLNTFKLDLDLTPEILENIQNRAVMMGIDTDYAIRSVIIGVVRQSNKWLDNLGIIVDSEAAYARLASQLGITTKQLTAQQKQMAFTAAAVDAMSGKAPELSKIALAGMQAQAAWDDAMTNLNDLMAELTPVMAEIAIMIRDLALLLRDIFAPVLKILSDMLVPILEILGAIVSAIGEWVGRISQMITMGWELLKQNEDLGRTLEHNRMLTVEWRLTLKDIVDIQDQNNAILETQNTNLKKLVALHQQVKELAIEHGEANIKFQKLSVSVQMKSLKKLGLKELSLNRTRLRFIALRTEQATLGHKTRIQKIEGEHKATLDKFMAEMNMIQDVQKREHGLAAARFETHRNLMSASKMRAKAYAMEQGAQLSSAQIEFYKQAEAGLLQQLRALDKVGIAEQNHINNLNEIRTTHLGYLFDAKDASEKLMELEIAGASAEYDALIKTATPRKKKLKQNKQRRDTLMELLALQEREAILDNRRRLFYNATRAYADTMTKILFTQKMLAIEADPMKQFEARLKIYALEMDLEKLRTSAYRSSSDTLQVAKIQLKVAMATDQEARKMIQLKAEETRAFIELDRLRRAALSAFGGGEPADIARIARLVEAKNIQMTILGIEIQRLNVQKQIEEKAQFWYDMSNELSGIGSGFSGVNREMAAVFGTMSKLTKVQGDHVKGTLTGLQATQSSITAVGTLGAAFAAEERTKAGIMAAVEAANAIAAAAELNFYSAAKHTLAAFMYGAVAAGGGGGGGGGGGAEAGPEREREQGPASLTFNFGEGIILGGADELGRAIGHVTAQASKGGFGGAV